MKKVVIVGGGIAGLSAGIYARRAGFETEIYEKNAVAGGQCMGWNRKGCHIDNCLHWLTGTKKGTGLRKIWEETGALDPDTEFVKSDKFYTACVGKERVTLWRDLDRTKRELTALSPEDREETERFIAHVKYAMCCEMPVEKPMDEMGIMDYIKLMKAMGDMPKVAKAYGKINLSDMAAKFKNPALRAMITDYMPGEYTATPYLVSYATIASGNGDVPKGGSLAMAGRMVKRYEELGGRLYCGCPVKKIRLNGKTAEGILLEDGREIKGDYIICATDTMEMFENLIGKQWMDKKWKACFDNEQAYPTFSGLQAAFVIDREFYEETDTVFFDCRPFTVGERTIERMSVKSYEYEPEFAPEGKTVLQSNVLQTDEEYRYWKALDREEYEKRKAEFAEELKERIIEKFPKLSGHIELLDAWTPVTYERYCNAYHGAYMSFITKKDSKSYNMKGVVKGLKHLYLAGQWLQFPGGLPVAAATGKFAVQRILKEKNR